MDVNINQLIQTLAIYALPVLFAITLHEAAHGYVARHFGDMTAHAQGRISLNPGRHIDLVGTIIVPLVILFLSGYTDDEMTLRGLGPPSAFVQKPFTPGVLADRVRELLGW